MGHLLIFCDLVQYTEETMRLHKAAVLLWVFLFQSYVKHLTYQAADKEFWVVLGFQGLLGTKHLYPDSLLILLPKNSEALWEQVEDRQTVMRQVSPATKQRCTGTTPKLYLLWGISCLL